MRCSAKLSEGDRQSVFAEFWGLADYNLQREYLAEHMHREEKLGPSGLTRTIVLYYLTHHKKVQVNPLVFMLVYITSVKLSEQKRSVFKTGKLQEANNQTCFECG